MKLIWSQYRTGVDTWHPGWIYDIRNELVVYWRLIIDTYAGATQPAVEETMPEEDVEIDEAVCAVLAARGPI